MKQLPRLDSLDERIRYCDLRLEQELAGLPEPPLPAGYRFVFYRPGDRESWIAVEQSAGEFDSREKGLAAWTRYYGGHEAELPDRMLFVENAAGEKVATATAFYDVIHGDRSGDGWLHWVAVRREYQGRGISKPLILRALGRLRELGYTRACIPTQTTTWLAVKIYLDLGFRPTAQSAVEHREGWRIIRTLTGHPALGQFPPATVDEILGEVKP